MNDANTRAAATEAAPPNTLHESLANSAATRRIEAQYAEFVAAQEAFSNGQPVSERLAVEIAEVTFAKRTGKAPNPAQADALLQQVKRGYIDGQPAKIDHSQPAPPPYDAAAALEAQMASWNDVTGMLAAPAALQGTPAAPRKRKPSKPAAPRAAAAIRPAARDNSLTIAEAAELSGYTERAIRARVDRGTLRTWKGDDNRRRIPRADLEHAGLLDPNAKLPTPAEPEARQGSSLASPAADTGMGDTVRFLVERMEAALTKAHESERSAMEMRLLTMQAETRLQQAESAAKRNEELWHEARAEADALRDRLDVAAVAADVAAKLPASEEPAAPRRGRWWQRQRP